MTDEYWKKRAADMEHHEPAHKTQGKSLDDVLNGIPGMPANPNTPRPNNGEVDVSNIMAQRLAQHMQTQGMPGQAVQQAQQQQQQQQMVCVREGVQGYRRLEAESYGHTAPLARNIGPLSGVSGKEFEFKGIVRAYIVEGNQTIDMGNVDPSKMKQLAVISAPFLGTFMVPESALFSPGGSGRKVLKG